MPATTRSPARRSRPRGRTPRSRPPDQRPRQVERGLVPDPGHGDLPLHTNGAALAAPCPDAVQFAANGAAQSVTRTVAATDGGVATVTAAASTSTDSVPAVKVTGIRNGGATAARRRRRVVSLRDTLSGVASCTIARHTSGTRTSYTARATDRAGNTTMVHGTYRMLAIYLEGVTYSDGAFTVHTGHTYRLVETDRAGRPTYYDAAVYPHRPTKREVSFHPAGHHRWVLDVTITRSMRGHQFWNLGVKIGSTMHAVKVRVA